MRKGQVSFQWGKHNQVFELVKWNPDNETHYVLAFFRKGKEGFHMETVGDRFFEDDDAHFVAKHAMFFLNELFYAEEE